MVNELLLRKSHGDKEDTKIDPSPLDAVSATPRVTAPIGIGEQQALKNGQEGCSLYINLDLIFLKNIFKDVSDLQFLPEPLEEKGRPDFLGGFLGFTLVKEEQKDFLGKMKSKAIVGKSKSKQGQFFIANLQRLLSPETGSVFDDLPAVQAAQFKFEVEDKLRRFYLRPGGPADFVFTMAHKSRLSDYGIDETEHYPVLAGYCLLVRDLSREQIQSIEGSLENLNVYLERVVAESIDAEFRAYMGLPEIYTEELQRWFIPDSPAFNEILNLLTRHHKRGWVISNPLNPSTKRFLSVKVKRIEGDTAFINTLEYWYLRWWDQSNDEYTYPYRETNRQSYVLKKDRDGWKVFENLSRYRDPLSLIGGADEQKSINERNSSPRG